jgi:hypothetical protein
MQQEGDMKNGKKKAKRKPARKLTKVEQEKERLRLMRQASADAGSRTNISGSVKTRGSRRTPVTLPAAAALKKLGVGEEQ